MSESTEPSETGRSWSHHRPPWYRPPLMEKGITVNIYQDPIRVECPFCGSTVEAKRPTDDTGKEVDGSVSQTTGCIHAYGIYAGGRHDLGMFLFKGSQKVFEEYQRMKSLAGKTVRVWEHGKFTVVNYDVILSERKSKFKSMAYSDILYKTRDTAKIMAIRKSVETDADLTDADRKRLLDRCVEVW